MSLASPAVATIEEVLAERRQTCRFRSTSGRATRTASAVDEADLKTAWAAFDTSGREFWQRMDTLVDMLDVVLSEEVADV